MIGTKITFDGSIKELSDLLLGITSQIVVEDKCATNLSLQLQYALAHPKDDVPITHEDYVVFKQLETTFNSVGNRQKKISNLSPPFLNYSISTAMQQLAGWVAMKNHL